MKDYHELRLTTRAKGMTLKVSMMEYVACEVSFSSAVDIAIKILHIIATVGTYAAILELLLTVIIHWLSH